MSKELVISANRHETRVALLEDDQLVEVYFQRANEYSLAGSIHKGRVTRVLPGMQSAFVDLGLERDTFLYVSDFLEEEHEDIDRVTGDERPPAARGRDRDRDRDRRPPAVVPAPQEPTAAVSAPAADEAPLPDGSRSRRSRRSSPSNARGAAVRASSRQRGRGSRPARTPLAPPPQSRTRIPRIEVRRGRTRGCPRCPAARRNRGRGRTCRRPHRTGGNSVETRAETPLVLPGESLAKYRGAPRAAPVEHATVRPSSVPPPLPTEEDHRRADRAERIRGTNPLSAGERAAGRSRALRAGRITCLGRTRVRPSRSSAAAAALVR